VAFPEVVSAAGEIRRLPTTDEPARLGATRMTLFLICPVVCHFHEIRIDLRGGQFRVRTRMFNVECFFNEVLVL